MSTVPAVDERVAADLRCRTVKSDQAWIVRHGALLIYDLIAAGNLLMIIAARKPAVFPVFGFVILINILYLLTYCISCRKGHARGTNVCSNTPSK